jgi:hypothetical protein
MKCMAFCGGKNGVCEAYLRRLSEYIYDGIYEIQSLGGSSTSVQYVVWAVAEV